MIFKRTITAFTGTIALFGAAAWVAYAAQPAHADTVTASVVNTAEAAGAATSTNSCGPTPTEVQQIQAIQNDSSLSYSAELQKELALRKQLVGETITCAATGARSLRGVLASTTVPTGSGGLKSSLDGQLNDELNFYNLELQKLNNVGIAGTQEIAQEVLSRRQGTFESLEGEVSNFILWSENQNLFDTAQMRMDATAREVSFLESASSNSDLQAAFNAAYQSFQSAKDANSQAQAALAQFLPPAQSLALIQKSLNSLADTYQGFFKVSKVIQKILPQ